jgi:uroporphyrinogen III methyltransferase/synthase
VLEKGTTPEQHRISASVGTLEDVCAAAEVQMPAIIVVGKVCSLADSFSWFENAQLSK